MQAVQTDAGIQVRMDTTRIARVECFRFDREAGQLLVPGSGSGDCCGILKMSTASGDSGIGVFRVCAMKDDFVRWACAFQRIKHATLVDGIREALLKQESWGDARTAAVVTAIHALARRPGAAADAAWPAGCFRDASYCFRHADAYVIF